MILTHKKCNSLKKKKELKGQCKDSFILLLKYHPDSMLIGISSNTLENFYLIEINIYYSHSMSIGIRSNTLENFYLK